eukprot:2824395-Pyramimonas_sp.AAC.1
MVAGSRRASDLAWATVRRVLCRARYRAPPVPPCAGSGDVDLNATGSVGAVEQTIVRAAAEHGEGFAEQGLDVADASAIVAAGGNLARDVAGGPGARGVVITFATLKATWASISRGQRLARDARATR